MLDLQALALAIFFSDYTSEPDHHFVKQVIHKLTAFVKS